MDRLSEEREVVLIERAKQGNEKAMLELMEAYKPAIRAQVRKIEPFYPVDDADQEAKYAFQVMVLNHDSEKGRLYQRVKAELGNWLREVACLQSNRFNIKPRTQRRFQAILNRAGHDPAVGAKIASENGMAETTFTLIYNSLYNIEALYDENGEVKECQSLYGDQIVDADTARLVAEARAVLSNEESIVIDAAYGFTHYEPMSDYEISRGLISKSPSTVRRIRNQALTKMRLAVAAA